MSDLERKSEAVEQQALRQQLCEYYGCADEQLEYVLTQLDSERELYYKCQPEMESLAYAAMLENKRELAERGRSRLAQFGCANPNKVRKHNPRPYWFRVRSFCVRSPYG